MKCPVDQSELNMTDRQGIEIDYCPQCRGVWLDRGELDKIIERSSSTTPSTPVNQSENYGRPEYREPQQDRRPSRDDSDQYGQHSNKKRKKEGFLGDLFDF